jgi:hypothetical protein
MRAVFVVALLSFASCLYAQANRATVSGVVTDAQGAVVAGATVSATDTATGVVTSTKTNDAGLYSMGNLEIGTYSVAAEHPGFQKYVHSGIQLTTGQVLGLDIPLQLGQVTETVVVAGQTPLLESRTSEIGQLLESQSIADLPLGDRRTMNVIQTMGAAVFVSYAAGAVPVFSLAGGRTQTQMSWIDGGASQNMRLGAPQVDVDPPIESVQEIKVLSNNYAAEYGASAGGVIIETTKSGTNQFRGSVYEFLRNNAMDAPGFFAPVQGTSKLQPELRYNLFGASLGGPIRHNKTFFFANYEAQRRKTGSVLTLTVPSALQAAGNFSQTRTAAGALIPIYDPASTQTVGGAVVRTQFPGNVIPASQLDAVALKALAYDPLPNRAPDNASGANNFRANQVVGLTSDFILAKVDHNFNDRDRLSGRFAFNKVPKTNSSPYPSNGAADSAAYTVNHQQYYYADWTHILSPTLVNNLRFAYDTRVFHNLTNGVGGDYPEKLGLNGVSNNAFPHFAPAGFSALGSANQERRQYPITSDQIVDDLSWVKGRHSLKFGVEARRSRDHEINLPTASGDFTFATQPTGLPGVATSGNGLASMLLGFPTAFTATQTDITDRTSWYLAGFVQDQFTISKSLTLNLGVRWETDTPMVDAHNFMNGFDSLALNPVSGTPGVVKFMGVNGYRTSAANADLNNFGPRFGFAWMPFRSTNTVVRGGYGIFYAHPFDTGQPASAELGFSQSVTLNTPDNGITAPFRLASGVPAVHTSTTLDDSFGAVPVGTNPSTAVTYFDPARRIGYSEQFNLGVQRQLSTSTVLEVSFIGNISHKLAGANEPIDQILPSVLSAKSDTQAYRPFPQFSNVTILGPSIGDSRYLAGLVKFERRFSHGLNFGATYTYSQFLDNNWEGGGTLGADNGPYSNFYNRRADWGPSANDIRSRFTFNTIYELPFGKGKRWLTTGPLAGVLGGWTLGNVTAAQSGPPFTVITQTNTTNAFSSGSLRANVIGDPNANAPRTAAAWFNTAAFAQPAAFQFGNEGIGAMRAPGLVNLDFSVLRNFRIRERMVLNFRGEFFNALNHTNFGLPGSTFGGPGFAVISSSGSARVIEVGARLAF